MGKILTERTEISMIFISHRGNLNGADTDNENHPEYIKNALDEGYQVEIDVWSINNKLFLGHDNPEYSTDSSFLMQSGLLCHAKNLEALECLLRLNTHCFYHDKDSYVLTSKGLIVSFPENALNSRTICMKPELLSAEAIKGCYGLCSDYIEIFRSNCEETHVNGACFNSTR